MALNSAAPLSKRGGNNIKEETMKRIAVLFAAALLTLSLSGIVCAEEAKPVEKKDAAAATEAKPAKKLKKKKTKKCPEGAAEMKKEGSEGAAPAAKPAKKKKEAAGC
jgi:hypothetical protein